MSELSPRSAPRAALLRESLRLAPVRPDVAAGLRAGLATVLPLLLAVSVRRPELIWSGIAGFQVVLVDKGGAYRTRTMTMVALALVCAPLVAIGMLSAEHTWLALPLVLGVVGVGGFLRVFGAEATALGVTMSVTLVIALSRPAHSLPEALHCAGFYVVGNAWASAVALVFWPLRVHRPARVAVVRVLRALSNVAASLAGASRDAAREALRAQLRAVRQAIELARATLAASRRSRLGPTRMGDQLLALLEAADQLFAALVALEDGLALESSEDLRELADLLDRTARLVASELQRCAAALESETPWSEARPNAEEPGALAEAIAPRLHGAGSYVPIVVARTLERLERVVINARAVDDARAERISLVEPIELSSAASLGSLLRDNLTLDSAVFRHALRAAIATALALSCVHALALEHGYWATLTCLVTLQPQGVATWTRALQRVLGTVVGAGLAVLVATFLHAPLALTACIFVFVTVAVSLLPVNYAAFAVFLTPAFVLMAEGHVGGANLAGLRVVNTLLGAALALLGSRMLFPLAERDQLRPLMVKVLAALARLIEIAALPQPPADELARARSRLGLALVNAEASFQRLLSEERIAEETSAALQSLLLYVHRFASGVIALGIAEGTAEHVALASVASELSAAVSELSECVAVGHALGATEGAAREPVAPRVDLLRAQLDVMRSAIGRWHAPVASGSP